MLNTEEMDAVANSSEAMVKVNKWFDEAKKFRERQEKRWRINEALVANKIDMTGLESTTDFRANLPLSIIYTILPIMRDYLPSFDVMPNELNDGYWADLVQDRADQLKRLGRFDNNCMKTVYTSLEKGDGLMLVDPVFRDVEVEMEGNPEPMVEKSLKKINYIPVDPFTWFQSPHATGLKLGDECRYQILAFPMHVDEIKAYAKELGVDLEEVAGEGNLDEYRSMIEVELDRKGEGGKYALLKYCFSDDLDKETYPNGRLTVGVGAQLISDEPLMWPRIPLFKISNYKAPFASHGTGEPELIETQVRALNGAMSSVFDNLKEFGSPKRKIVANLWEKFKGGIPFKDRKNIKVMRQDDISYLQPSGPTGASFSAIQLTLTLVDIVSGVQDQSRGKDSPDATSGKAILALQEAAQTRVRYKIREEVTEFIEEIGDFTVFLIKNYDKEARTIRKQDEAGEMEFIKFDPMYADEEKGLKPLADTEFDIQVVAGFTQPAGRAAVEETALNKMEMGIYGIEDYAMRSGEPDKRGLIERYYERQGQVPPEEVAKAQEELGKMAQGEILPGSPEEEQIVQMIQAIPQLIVTEEFGALQPEVKERIIGAIAA